MLAAPAKAVRAVVWAVREVRLVQQGRGARQARVAWVERPALVATPVGLGRQPRDRWQPRDRGAVAANKVFDSCRFHFGTIDSVAKANPSMIPQVDTFTTGWMGQKDTFDMSYVCTEANAGGKVAGKVPVLVAYVAAFYAKRHFGRCDCNVTTCGANNDLCHYGAADITSNLTSIINVYKSYAQGFASCYGTTEPIVFEMEPDWYQYTYTSQQTMALTEAQAGTDHGAVRRCGQAVPAERLPSRWTSRPGSAATTTRGGRLGQREGLVLPLRHDDSSASSTRRAAARTRPPPRFARATSMTWAGVSQVTGKPILADTGYGVNGSSAGPDPNWDMPANINARIATVWSASPSTTPHRPGAPPSPTFALSSTCRGPVREPSAVRDPSV